MPLKLWDTLLHIKADLYLLLDETRELVKAPFYNPDFRKYVSCLSDAIEYLIEKHEKLPITSAECREITNLFWRATKYLKGSTSNQISHETVYTLRKALGDWINPPYLITTALLEELNYHFLGLNAGHAIKFLVGKGAPTKDIDIEIIQMALPKIYRHRPLNNVVLYHELGHFVDHHHGITKLMILSLEHAGQTVSKSGEEHLQEHFADLFAASYTGDAISCFLSLFAEGYGASESHPATDDRIQIIENFLAGKKVDLVDSFNLILAALKLPLLEKKYAIPDVEASFSDIRPYDIANDPELHGIHMAGRKLLQEALKRDKEPWKEVSEYKVSKVINNLVEKSIRNKMLKGKWAHATATS